MQRHRSGFHRWLLPLLGALLAGCGQPAGDDAAAVIPGIDPGKKTITVGMLNDESGPVGAIGRPWAAGKRILRRQVNAGGSGLLPDGWTLEYLERDHGSDPERVAAAFKEMRARVLFIGTSFGTANTLALRPQLQRNGLVAFPASLSSQMGEFEYTPPLAPSYRIEALRGLDWAVQRAGAAEKLKLGLVYQQDEYGTEVLEAVTGGAQRLGVALVSTQPYAAGQADYAGIVGALRQAGATQVMLATVPSATGPILGIAAQLKYQPLWIGNSPSWTDRFFDPTVVPPSNFANYHWVMSTAYWGEKVPFMKAFLAAYEQYGRELAPPDYYVMAAYWQGLLEVEIARRMIESGDLSRAGYLRALRGLAGYDPGGAIAGAPDFTRLPYVAGTRSRVLKPDFARASWTVAGEYATPSTLTPE